MYIYIYIYAYIYTYKYIFEELDEEKNEVDVESIEGVEKKKTYAEVLSKVVTNTIETHSKPKNIDKNKIMEPNVSRVNCSLRGDNKIEDGENIHFAIENKMPDGKKNEFTPEREQKVEGKVFVRQHMNASRVSNYNVNLKLDNVLSANDEDLVNIL